jgi:metal-responsive CopG/Arc/MetJ family transcriptional regulator
MTRILADLPEDDLRALDALAARNGRSRAAEIREAVDLYLRRRADKSWIRRGQGYWSERSDSPDGIENHLSMRQRRDRG